MPRQTDDIIKNSTLTDILEGLNDTITRLDAVDIHGLNNMSLFVVCVQGLRNLAMALDNKIKEGEAIEFKD